MRELGVVGGVSVAWWGVHVEVLRLVAAGLMLRGHWICEPRYETPAVRRRNRGPRSVAGAFAQLREVVFVPEHLCAPLSKGPAPSSATGERAWLRSPWTLDALRAKGSNKVLAAVGAQAAPIGAQTANCLGPISQRSSAHVTAPPSDYGRAGTTGCGPVW
jgi:hypothetical protein